MARKTPDRQGHRGDSRSPKRERPSPSPQSFARRRKGNSESFSARSGEERRPPRFRATGADDLLCWGRNPVITLLREHPELCRQLIVAEGVQMEFRESVLLLAEQARVPLRSVERELLDHMTDNAVHQGVALSMKPIAEADLNELLDKTAEESRVLMVLLDHCQDPHNLGAVIRSAEAAGARAVIVQKDRSVSLSGTVIKTSAGAAFRVPVASVINVVRTLEVFKKAGFWVVGLDHNAEGSLWQEKLPERTLLVVGAEGKGIAPLVRKNCDLLVTVPMAGSTGSLNASVAAALGLFEWARQQGPFRKEVSSS